MLTIGQLARSAGVGVETVRFYERQGLLDPPERKASGYRCFDHEVVARLRFIRRAKELGFTLKEIKELLSLRLDSKSDCAAIKQRAQAKIKDIDDRIDTLQRMKEALIKLTKECRGKGPTSECPILDALENREV